MGGCASRGSVMRSLRISVFSTKKFFCFLEYELGYFPTSVEFFWDIQDTYAGQTDRSVSCHHGRLQFDFQKVMIFSSLPLVTGI